MKVLIPDLSLTVMLLKAKLGLIPSPDVTEALCRERSRVYGWF